MVEVKTLYLHVISIIIIICHFVGELTVCLVLIQFCGETF